MTYTDKQMFAALANAHMDALTAIFGDNALDAATKASRKLATLENRKPREKDNSKYLANLATFNEKVLSLIEREKCVTTANVRDLLGEGVTSSKTGAILRAGVAEGLIERHDVRATDNLAVKCGTYYTVPGYRFAAKA